MFRRELQQPQRHLFLFAILLDLWFRAVFSGYHTRPSLAVGQSAQKWGHVTKDEFHCSCISSYYQRGYGTDVTDGSVINFSRWFTVSVASVVSCLPAGHVTGVIAEG